MSVRFSDGFGGHVEEHINLEAASQKADDQENSQAKTKVAPQQTQGGVWNMGINLLIGSAIKSVD